MPRPQPKPEPIREFRRVTLAENVTVKEIAEKLEARTKDVIKKLMDRVLQLVPADPRENLG